MCAMKTNVPVGGQGKEAAAGRGAAPVPYGWEPFGSLRSEIDRLFEDVTSGWGVGRALERMPWKGLAMPATDIVENDKEFVATVELPGLEEKDIDVKVSDGAISISAEKSEEIEEEKENYRLHERRYGSFARSFTLPISVDPERISASYDKGVLKLVMPKTEEAKKKQHKIEVKAA